MSKAQSPCATCGKCKNPDTVYTKCKHWRGWFNYVWRRYRKKGKELKKLRERESNVYAQN